MEHEHTEHSTEVKEHKHIEHNSMEHAEHKHVAVEQHAAKKMHVKKSTIWQVTTAIFAILFFAAILTRGFSGTGNVAQLEQCVNNIDKVSSQVQSAELKDLLTTTKNSLMSAKALLDTKTAAPAAGAGDKVKVDFYVMSKCPYGIQVEDGIKPVLDKLGKSVDFSINFIANDNGDGTFKSLHGDTEVAGDIVQLCAMKYAPDTYMDMIICQNKDSAGIAGNWQSCATGMDIAKIKACSEGDEGKTLLKASIAKANAVQASGSPTIYIGGASYSGGRAATDFLRAICDRYTTKPAACSDIPAAVKVNMIAFSDKRCKDCDVTSLVSQLKGMFPGLVVKNMDYNDPDGKKFYADNGLTTLPSLLFDADVAKADGYANIERYLQPKGSYQELRIGSAFDPTKEICDNNIDDNANGQIDCADADCKESMVCREEIKKKLDVFVMSQCPYGVQGLNAMQEVLANFKGNIDFNIHYIADANADGTFSSLHGQPEVDEDLRELCVMDLYPTGYKYMDYILCRNKDIKNTAWEACATSNGMDAAKIKACAEGAKGKELLTASLKSSQALGISASPTWLANNKVQFSGIDAQTVKTNFCTQNPGLAGCDKTLTGQAASATPAGACG
jgi:hypothetical protein